jgi:hypothetical protein
MKKIGTQLPDQEPEGVPMAAIPVKDLGLQTKVLSLQQLFITLRASLNPLVLHTSEGQEVVKSAVEPGVRTSIETALVQTCNRISDFMSDDRNWVDDSDARELLGNLIQRSVAEHKAAAKPKRAPKKKGSDNEQK